MDDRPARPGGPAHSAVDGSRPGPVIPVISPGDWAYDPQAEVWRPLTLIEAGLEIGTCPPDQLDDMLDTGAELPSWFASAAVAAELRHAGRRARSEVS